MGIVAAVLGGALETWRSERRLLWEVTREMVGLGLVEGSSGNASLRLSGAGAQRFVLITPTLRPYRCLEPEDLTVVDLEGDQVEGDLPPTSETALHLKLYEARDDIGAIIHTHSTFASVAAVAGLEIPPVVDEMVIKVGGSVKVSDYGFPSSEELAQRACLALGDRNAVLLRNHGLVGVGLSLRGALEVCQLVERVAKIFFYALQLGKANSLPPEIIELERQLFLMQRSSYQYGGSQKGDEKGGDHGNSP